MLAAIAALAMGATLQPDATREGAVHRTDPD
jgi:hypothetical protein